jgi:hypothetical protein
VATRFSAAIIAIGPRLLGRTGDKMTRKTMGSVYQFLGEEKTKNDPFCFLIDKQTQRVLPSRSIAFKRYKWPK